jgi:integrase
MGSDSDAGTAGPFTGLVPSGCRRRAEAVCLVVRGRVQAAGIDPGNYSGHSLRAGLATSAAQAGVSSWKIRMQTGHASDAMLVTFGTASYS